MNLNDIECANIESKYGCATEVLSSYDCICRVPMCLSVTDEEVKQEHNWVTGVHASPGVPP